MTRRVAITGASGYIGRALVRAALAEGWQVRALTRRRSGDGRVEFVAYDLDSELQPGALAQVDTVVHLAADTKAGSGTDVLREQAAARRLFGAAGAGGVRVVFVSSQAARADAPSGYGRAKWLIEQEALAAGAVVVRPGLVYGGPERGLFGVLCAMVRRLPMLPDLRPRPLVQPIHVDDLAQGLLRLAADGEASGSYNLASAEGVSFTGLLQAIAADRLVQPRLFIPVPMAALLGAMRLGRMLGLGSDPDRLRSLRDLPAMATRHDLERLALRLRPLEAGMARSRRRGLLIEARAMLGYVLRARPPAGPVRRYVRAVEAVQDGGSLGLPAALVRWPACIGLLDWQARAGDRLGMRFEIATRLAESTIEGAERFLEVRGGWWRAAGTAGMAVCGELGLRLLRLPLAAWLARTRRRIGQGVG